jgi:putative transposase
LEGEVKTARIVRRAGKWFVRLTCEVPQPEHLPPTGEAVGIDVGLTKLATLSNGEAVENPRWYRRAQKRLRVAQRRVARREKGGARRRKAVVQLQRVALKVADRRKDFLDKLANDWINRFDRLAIEDLRVKAMARGRFAKSILDAGWSYLRSRLAQKAACAARELELKEPRGTSQDCSGCGATVPKKLSVRVHGCPHCGLEMDRDENAARNILNRAGHARRTPSSPSGRVGPRSRAA